MLFPYVVSSDDEQHGCAKSTCDEACLAPEASWKRSECKTHQGHDAKRNAPELTIGGALQSKDEPVVTRPLCFHILMGRLHLASL